MSAIFNVRGVSDELFLKNDIVTMTPISLCYREPSFGWVCYPPIMWGGKLYTGE